MEKTIEECRENIQKFANDHKVIFEDEGEIGFCRPCVGLLRGNCYVAYNPYDYASEDYDYIQEYYDQRLYDIVPEDGYHKADHVAVLVRDTQEEALRQLSDWVDALRELKVSLEEYPTGATGMQAMLTGVYGYCFKVNKRKPAKRKKK